MCFQAQCSPVRGNTRPSLWARARWPPTALSLSAERFFLPSVGSTRRPLVTPCCEVSVLLRDSAALTHRGPHSGSSYCGHFGARLLSCLLSAVLYRNDVISSLPNFCISVYLTHLDQDKHVERWAGGRWPFLLLFFGWSGRRAKPEAPLLLRRVSTTTC